MASTGRPSVSKAPRKSSCHLEVPVTLSLFLVTLAHFAPQIAANNCPSFRPIGVDCPPATSGASASTSDAANPACKSQAYLGRFAVQGSKRFRLPALPHGVPLPPGALAADCCAECQQRADCAYWNILLRPRRCLLFAADVCAADGPAVFLPGEENAFVGTRYCNATKSVTRTTPNTADTTQDGSTPSESALSLFEDAIDEDEQEAAEGQAEERAEAEEEHDAHVMGVLEGDMARMQAEEAEELNIVEAASQVTSQAAAMEAEKAARENKEEAKKGTIAEQAAWRDLEQQEIPAKLTSYEMLDADALAANQAAAMEEEAAERRADASVAALKDLEEQEIPVKLTSYEMVDAGSLADRQAAAMEEEREERQESERAAVLRQLEEQEIPVWLNLRGHSAFHTTS
ncbi:unnamed protein product [Closterium sp. Yama58-4]|nr:unnamed protein product [Closterium sp. Yama58-4]